jgi:hypothetical protein
MLKIFLKNLVAVRLASEPQPHTPSLCCTRDSNGNTPRLGKLPMSVVPAQAIFGFNHIQEKHYVKQF